jgi:hypothetical protein
MEIYDNGLTLLKQIFGPDKLPAKYSIIGDEYVSNEIIFHEYIPYAYLEFCTDANYFYTTYMGDNLTNGKKMEDYPLWIFKFDWDGNLTDSYYVGRYVSSISLSSDGNSFYATAISKEGNPFLIKLSIICLQ